MKTEDLVIYQSLDGKIKLEVRWYNETVWLNQAQMAELFQTSSQNITMHIRNVYEDGELEGIPTCKDFLQVRQEGRRSVKRNVAHYSLDMILSVGYRVKSKSGIQFRIWANKVLKDYIINGYAIQRPVSKQEFDKAITELEQQIINSEKFTEEQISEVYKTLAEFFSRKQIDEKPRKQIGFRSSKQE